MAIESQTSPIQESSSNGGSIADQSQNPASLYYIHPSESPSTVLVSPILSGSNYHSWARAMRMALVSKNKMSFVDGTIQIPRKEDLIFPAWERANTLVSSWILRSISSQISKSVLWMDVASEIWSNLKERFSQGDIFRIADLQETIASFRQGELNVGSYFTELKILWDEVENFRPSPMCRCTVKCSCGLIDEIKKHRLQDQVIRFLKGLNDSYGTVKTQIMLMDPLPSLTKAFSLVVQQERQMFGEIAEPKLVAAVQGFDNPNFKRSPFGRGSSSSNYGRGTNMHGSGARGSGSMKICTHCGKSGHTVEVCYRKHGFPPNYRFKNASNHANAVISDNKATMPCDDPQESQRVQSFGFTPEQCQSLLALIQQSSSSNQSTPHMSNQVSSHTQSEIQTEPPSGHSYVEDDWYS